MSNDSSFYSGKWSNPAEHELSEPINSHRRGGGWTKKRKMAVAGVAVAGVLIPGAAWAAVSLFGFGSFSADAATTTNLTINGKPTLDGRLVPGQTRGVTGSVHNPNDFPVSIDQLILKTSSLHAVPPSSSKSTEADCKITVAGGNPGTFPANGSDASAPGIVFVLKDPVKIGPNQDAVVSVPGVVKQDSTAEVLCGVTGDYAVRGQTSTN